MDPKNAMQFQLQMTPAIVAEMKKQLPGNVCKVINLTALCQLEPSRTERKIARRKGSKP